MTAMARDKFSALEDSGEIRAVVQADHKDPFRFLGMHKDDYGVVVRAFLPQAKSVELVDTHLGRVVAGMKRVHRDGFFVARVRADAPFPYRFRVAGQSSVAEIEDPYRFPPALGPVDLHLMAEGNHFDLYRKLGAHRRIIDGVEGVGFAVWAANARRVSVVGDFNDWDGRRHQMRFHPGAGIWEIFVPGIREGALYKYEIRGAGGELLPLKADPFALRSEQPPSTASIVAALKTGGSDEAWAKRRGEINARQAKMAIYEVHPGSWRRRMNEGGRALTYRELADELVPYVKDMGFSHIEFTPLMEHPFGGSWGYQPLALFAPTSRYGTPEDLRYLIRRCHEQDIGVILDWVPAHFPEDEHGLVLFDGTHLYEYSDERLGRHPDWGSLIYNLARREVANFLIANALYWFEQFEVDGLRVDAVASMLYRDYSRKAGEWLPNQFGGRENIEAIDFFRRLNHEVLTRFPGAVMIAEESTAWPMVTRPPEIGGLGFSYKWNMGWMNDTLRYFSLDPVFRKFHQKELTFGLMYAFSENFILPLSHDEVVHGKGSLLGKMKGDDWRRFANLRAYYGFMFTQPGKKLMFMGDELAQGSEWNHDSQLEWHLLNDERHQGVQRLVRDLNTLYAAHAALHEKDCEEGGFTWIDCSDQDASVVSYIRRGNDPRHFLIVIGNFTPVVRETYRIGVPEAGAYREILNTDSTYYGGSNMGNLGRLEAEGAAAHGHGQSLVLTLPPLSVLVLVPERDHAPLRD
jgi:1,4-alpha-glucan branching enzyme